ncbi:MAG: AAA family ATPase [Xenococcaceae cyanobacterium]
MSLKFQKLAVKNYRSLEHIEVHTKGVNVLFGPNGAGKTTFLDAIWFVRDCAIRGVDIAASDRSYGIGVLWNKAEPGAHISIEIETEQAIYNVKFGFSSGRIESYVGETLTSKNNNKELINRTIGSSKVSFFHSKFDQLVPIELREPQKLALNRYLDFEDNAFEAAEVDRLLHYTRKYHARSADLYRLRTYGSESDSYRRLYDRCENLWSVLRNVRDQREIGDKRYETIIKFMQKSFPTFDKIYLEQQGANSVYGSFIENEHREPIKASGVSDGHLQLLTHLTALFSEGNRPTLILFDEPEVSLHPHALAVFAEAVDEAVSNWSKQVFIATHSPVLISQFDAENIIAAEIGSNGETIMQRVSEMEEIQDLLDEYAAGSLYMAELIAPQSRLKVG